ncbi:Nodulin-like [Seminavis robusta]|uniref:Nodulin-like n=1 Tax=Seminavis robusta TaxID=568900 RepID=A0A9N8EK10_9STRA|nr:Nodulin-like [Seminavis robusta]|eukprot:Sro1379_g267690.1 Nodulin-like (659) ;mRNA; r:9761-11808
MVVIKSPASPYYSPYHAGALPTNTTNKNSNGISNIGILVTAFLAILATGGPTYSFGVYAETLKATFSLTQSELDTLGAASFAAGLISWIPGLLVDAWGPRQALLWGGAMQSFGLACYWMAAKWGNDVILEATGMTSIIPILCGLSILIFTSNNMVIGGVFKSIVTSCELGTKGNAVGAAKAYLGLGAGVFSSLFHAIKTSSDLDFLAMSSVCAIVAIVLPAALALPTQQLLDKKGTKDDSTNQHYHVIYVGLLALSMVVVGSSALTLFSHQSNSSTTKGFQIPDWLHGVVILSFWIGPVLGLFLVPTSTALQESHRKQFQRSQSSIRRRVRSAMERDTSAGTLAQNKGERMMLLPPSNNNSQANKMVYHDGDNDDGETNIGLPTTSDDKQVSWRPDNDDKQMSWRDDDDDDEFLETPQPIPDRTLPEMLQTLPAWLFLGASTMLVGAGTMLTINMGQLVQSSLSAEDDQTNPQQTAAACLAMFSVSQALARVTAGAVSEAALQWKTTLFGIRRGVPRPAFLVLSCAFAVAGHAIMAMTTSSNLLLFVLGIVLTGISFGMLWPLMVLVVGDLFGTVNHGANYMFADGFTCAVGTLSIAKFLTQFVYEQHIEGDETTCFGEECFRITHAIISGLCLISMFACVALLYMTRSSYGTLLDER